MNKINTKERIRKIETELDVLKRLFTRGIDFSVDEKNWHEISEVVKKARKSNFRKTYGTK